MTELRSHAGCTKSALASILSTLHAKGLLNDAIGGGSARTVRGRIQSAIESSAQERTPYGKLIESMPLDDVTTIEYCNPFALLFLLCRMSFSFFSMLAVIGHRASPWKLVVNIDEMCPGNPMRPEKSRTTQCVYWTFADLPGNILVQSGMWFIFCTVRTTLVDKIPGKVSGFMRRILKTFFRERGNSFDRGFVVHHGDQSVVLTATFSGFVADEKALKEVYGFKGASGSKPCPTCMNVAQFLDETARAGTSIVPISCSEYRLLRYHTNDTFYAMVDRLQVASAGTKTALKQLEQIFGLNYDPANLLYDPYLRRIIRPTDHTLRDWMHTLVSHGLAGTEMAMLFAELATVGINLEQIATYAANFALPKARGKVDLSWFSNKRVADDHLRCFASEQLNMIPIVHAFLEDVVRPAGVLVDHIQCFTLLRLIVLILSQGPHASMPHIDLLRQSIERHHQIYVTIYPDGVKPKFHQLLHIPEDMLKLGSLLACFVTERKHREVKAAALNVFRHYEHTVLFDLISQQLEHLCDDTLYKTRALVGAVKVTAGGVEMLSARSARFPSGEITAGDLVLCADRSVAQVEHFWSAAEQDNFLVQLRPLAEDAAGHSYGRCGAAPAFVNAADILEPLVWAERRPGVYRVCQAFGMLSSVHGRVS